MKIEFFNTPSYKGTAARAIRMIDECEGVVIKAKKFGVVDYYPGDGDGGCILCMLDKGESIEGAAEREVFWRGEYEDNKYDRVVITENTSTDGYIIKLYDAEEESDDPWHVVCLVPVENLAKEENEEAES